MGLPRVTMKGPAPHRACCGHSEAWHLDMCDGHEQCAGCDCRTPTGTVDTTPEHDLTPSEVALSKVLAALAAWGPVCGGKLSDADRALVDASKGIAAHGFWLDGDVTEAGTALLDRARKAGVL